jgi:hypothetical protein
LHLDAHRGSLCEVQWKSHSGSSTLLRFGDSLKDLSIKTCWPGGNSDIEAVHWLVSWQQSAWPVVLYKQAIDGIRGWLC